MSLSGIGRICEGMPEEKRRAFLLGVLARNNAYAVSARETVYGLVALVFVIALLRWLLG